MSDVSTGAVIHLGELALKLGEVNRITFHSDGVTPESDTTHTVMLGLIACAFAHRHLPQLDIGLVAQYALVHDLVEAYAGDTPTLRLLTPEQKTEKAKREEAAFGRIAHEFVDDLPWLVFALRDYERSAVPEARYVRTMDKVLPKITHLLNDCAGLHENGITPQELRDRFEIQVRDLETRNVDDDFMPVFTLYAELAALVTGIFASGYAARVTSARSPVIEGPAEHSAFDPPQDSPDPVRAEMGRKVLQVHQGWDLFRNGPMTEWRLTTEQFSLLTDYRVPPHPESVPSVKIFGLPIVLVCFEQDSTLAGGA